MSEHADKYSKPERKERVDRILQVDPKARIDASGYTPPGPLNTEEKTGPCKPSPRAFAKGGKVDGEKSHHHAGRKSRDAGGSAALAQLRPQVPTSGLYGSGFSPTHAGMLSNAAGLKKGGEAKKRADGGYANWIAGATRHKGALHKKLHVPEGEKIPAKKLEKAEHSKSPVERKEANLAETLKGLHKAKGGEVPGNSEITGTRPTGGRMARKDGGRAKGKTNINIIIGAPKEQPPMVPPPPSAMPPGSQPKPGLPPAAMGAMQPPGMGGGMPPGGPMPAQMPSPAMPRASGGRTYPLDAGSGSGEGRIEKTKAYGL